MDHDPPVEVGVIIAKGDSMGGGWATKRLGGHEVGKSVIGGDFQGCGLDVGRVGHCPTEVNGTVVKPGVLGWGLDVDGGR